METEHSSAEHERQINKWMRWLLIAWIVVFSLAVGYAIHQNRNNTNEARKLVRENSRRIQDIRETKAGVKALQATNCGLVRFLLTARKTRYETYLKTHSSSDLRAVKGYELLVEPFIGNHHAIDNCPISKRILIPSRPLPRSR